MAYDPLYISRLDTDGDYGEIRIALGLAPDDTVTIPVAVIEARTFLPEVEKRMTPILADTCEIEMDSGDPDYDAAKADTARQTIILWTASRLAEHYLHARSGDKVKSHGIGPFSTTYAAGPDYRAMGEQLLAQAVDTLAQVCVDGAYLIFDKPFAHVTAWAGSALTVEGEPVTA